jgi:integrase
MRGFGGLPAKVIQERLGHSSITMSYDRYGHLLPRGEDAKALDAAEVHYWQHKRDMRPKR